ACARATCSRSVSTSACRPARWRRSRQRAPRRTPTWCRACSPRTASSISRRRSSCSCCRRCWRRRAAPCSIASRPTPCRSTRPRPRDWGDPPPRREKAPPPGRDAGSYLVAEAFAARSVILLKDGDGLYPADPKTHPDATFIPEIGAAELIRMQLPTLPIEPVVLELLARTKLVRNIRLVNGLVPGNLTRALAGEKVGTEIHA